jgi:hypothetical protein
MVPLSSGFSACRGVTRRSSQKWVDLDGRDQEGNPALVLAVAFGHAEAVRILVESDPFPRDPILQIVVHAY